MRFWCWIWGPHDGLIVEEEVWVHLVCFRSPNLDLRCKSYGLLEGLKALFENKSKSCYQTTSLATFKQYAHPINEHSNIDTCQKSTLSPHQSCIVSNWSQTLNKPILFNQWFKLKPQKGPQKKMFGHQTLKV